MIHWCINPACKAKIESAKYIYAEEAVCKACWKKLPQWLSHGHTYRVREWRRCEKGILMGSTEGDRMYYGRQFRYLAFAMAHNWSRIRFQLEVKPEFLGGLRSHLREVFNDYGLNWSTTPTLLPNFDPHSSATWGLG